MTFHFVLILNNFAAFNTYSRSVTYSSYWDHGMRFFHLVKWIWGRLGTDPIAQPRASSGAPESMSTNSDMAFLAGYLPFIMGYELFTNFFSLNAVVIMTWHRHAIEVQTGLVSVSPFQPGSRRNTSYVKHLLHRIKDCLCVYRRLGVTCGFQSTAWRAAFLSSRLGVFSAVSLYGDVDRLLTGSDP